MVRSRQLKWHCFVIAMGARYWRSVLASWKEPIRFSSNSSSSVPTDSGYVKEDWQFELPRKGRTIVVRSEKAKKILHKFSWNGEKFQEEK